MCIGIPVQIIEVKGFSGLARDGDDTVGIDLALTGPVPARHMGPEFPRRRPRGAGP
jgi:hypothetical protein